MTESWASGGVFLEGSRLHDAARICYWISSASSRRCGFGITLVMIAAVFLAGCSTGQRSLSRGISYLHESRSYRMTCELRSDDFLMLRAETQGIEMRSLKVPLHLENVIKRAARMTGVHADYLALTAARESNFNIFARARSSTATGLFQFVEQTWLALVVADGNCIGLGALVRHIDRDGGGKFRVSSPAVRRRILNFREDPFLSTILAARLAQRNAQVFRKLRGRPPTVGELYIAHFLGARHAAELSRLAVQTPGTLADRHFGSAAGSNKAIFYDGMRPRTVNEVYHVLVQKHVGWRVLSF